MLMQLPAAACMVLQEESTTAVKSGLRSCRLGFFSCCLQGLAARRRYLNM